MRTRPLLLLIWITTKTPRAKSIHSSPLGKINDAGISLWIPNIQWKAGWSQDLSASHGWMESSDLIDSNKGSIIQLIPIEIERIVWLPVQLLYLVYGYLLDDPHLGCDVSIKVVFWFKYRYIYWYIVLISFSTWMCKNYLEAVYECIVGSFYWYFQLKVGHIIKWSC